MHSYWNVKIHQHSPFTEIRTLQPKLTKWLYNPTQIVAFDIDFNIIILNCHLFECCCISHLLYTVKIWNDFPVRHRAASILNVNCLWNPQTMLMFCNSYLICGRKTAITTKIPNVHTSSTYQENYITFTEVKINTLNNK